MQNIIIYTIAKIINKCCEIKHQIVGLYQRRINDNRIQSPLCQLYRTHEYQSKQYNRNKQISVSAKLTNGVRTQWKG